MESPGQTGSTGPSAAKKPAGGELPEGQVVGGRFQVGKRAARDTLGDIYHAKDQKTGKSVMLRVIGAGVLEGAQAIERFRSEVKSAATVSHKNLLAVYGLGADGSGARYVATEPVDGVSLGVHIENRRASGGFSLRAAYNVVSHVCNALAAVHPRNCHGALRPNVVFVDRAGHVKVGDLGVARGVLLAAGPAGLGDATEQAYLAPEVKLGKEPTPACDVFGVGALLYVLLTGRSPVDEFILPSQARGAAVPADVDEIVMSCLAGDPAMRFANVNAIRNAMQNLLARTGAASPDDVQVEDLSVDVSLEEHEVSLDSIAPPAGSLSSPQIAVPRDSGAGPRVGDRISINDQFRPSSAGASAPAQAEVDLADMLRQISENDAERWIVQKDKLDHGPFSGRDLVQRMVKGEVLSEHHLLNTDTGERRLVSAWPEFAEFAEQYRIRKQKQDHEAALKRVEKSETRSGAAKFIIAAGGIGLIVAAVAVYAVTRQGERRANLAPADLANLYERGDVHVEGSAGILPPPTRARHGGGGGHHGSGGGGGGGGGSGGSYEEAMSRAADLGDVSQGGGSERQLSAADVASTMNRHINSFFGCVGAELRSGGSVGRVQIDLAIAGDGHVLGASVRSGSSTFRSCVSSRARSVRFPSFPAPRMGARYAFNVD